MKQIAMIGAALLLVLCAGCQTKAVIDETQSYTNETYGFEIIYPEEWISKVDYIDSGYVKFIYNQVMFMEVPVVGISIYTLEEWEQATNESTCCGSSEITRNDQFVFVEDMVLDMAFSCSMDAELIEDCEAKEQEYLNIVRAFDASKHFKLTEGGHHSIDPKSGYLVEKAMAMVKIQ